MRARRYPSPRRVLAVTTLVAAALALSSCGADENAEPEAGQDTSADNGAVQVTLVDYAYDGLPESVPAGTQFAVVNESAAELHELVAVRLPDDEDRAVSELAELPPDEMFAAFGEEPEPATVLLAEPEGGTTIPAVGDGSLTEPGRYAVMCFIPVGADPQEYLDAAAEAEEEAPQVEGGPPHYTQGMYGEVTVE